MKMFKMNASIMNGKDSKRICKLYNKVGRALVEFETLWVDAWCKAIESAKSGLQAPLLVKHPKSQKLFVNFDHEILKLIREAKCLERMQGWIPESARMVLLQEDKFKLYYVMLCYVSSSRNKSVVGMHGLDKDIDGLGLGENVGKVVLASNE